VLQLLVLEEPTGCRRDFRLPSVAGGGPAPAGHFGEGGLNGRAE
jgi:hypothetical protein